MAETHTMERIPGTYEIWRQYAGRKPRCILSIQSQYEVRDLMDLFMEDEREKGLWAKNVDGGFTSYYVHKQKKKPVIVPVTHYWFEEVMSDQHLKIDANVADWLAAASATAVAEVRKQEASAAADFQRDAEQPTGH